MGEARPGYSFPIARRAWRFARTARANWLDRHRHPFNFAIHLLGIPLALAGVACLFVLPWYWGGGLLALGYLLQFAGHWVEGNDVGELIPFKRALGLPVVAVVSRPAGPPPAA
ncbi:MAG TPA: Mpo1-like protein [Fimbriiglobus sp.]|nr:Mpo1-like protein [Fimbriiglobus sp.]